MHLVHILMCVCSVILQRQGLEYQRQIDALTAQLQAAQASTHQHALSSEVQGSLLFS